MGVLVVEGPLVQVGKVGVLERFTTSDAILRVERDHLIQQVQRGVVEATRSDFLMQLVSFPGGEGGFVVWQFGTVGPVYVTWSAHDLKHFKNLVNLRVSREERPPVHHFHEDRSNSPDIDGCRVSLLAEQDFRGSVPQRDHFMCVSFNG